MRSFDPILLSAPVNADGFRVDFFSEKTCFRAD
jgi:hypothetical protein